MIASNGCYGPRSVAALLPTRRPKSRAHDLGSLAVSQRNIATARVIDRDRTHPQLTDMGFLYGWPERHP